MLNITELSSIKLTGKMKDLTGEQRGSLTFIKPAENKKGRVYWWV